MELTIEKILNEWVYVGNTEANGKLYHDENSDKMAVVYSDYAKVFSGRREGAKGIFPACYDNVVRIEETE